MEVLASWERAAAPRLVSVGRGISAIAAVAMLSATSLMGSADYGYSRPYTKPKRKRAKPQKRGKGSAQAKRASRRGGNHAR